MFWILIAQRLLILIKVIKTNWKRLKILLKNLNFPKMSILVREKVAVWIILNKRSNQKNMRMKIMKKKINSKISALKGNKTFKMLMNTFRQMTECQINEFQYSIDPKLMALELSQIIKIIQKLRFFRWIHFTIWKMKILNLEK